MPPTPESKMPIIVSCLSVDGEERGSRRASVEPAVGAAEKRRPWRGATGGKRMPPERSSSARQGQRQTGDCRCPWQWIKKRRARRYFFLLTSLVRISIALRRLSGKPSLFARLRAFFRQRFGAERLPSEKTMFFPVFAELVVRFEMFGGEHLELHHAFQTDDFVLLN